MNKIEQELEAVKFTVNDLRKKQEETNDKELYDKIQDEIDSFEEYRIELLNQTNVLPPEMITVPVDDTDKKIQEHTINKEILEDLAMLEHEQWVEWSKSIATDLKRLIGLTSIEELSGTDHDFVVEQLDRLDRWNTLWNPYELIPEEQKDTDRNYARRVLNRLYFKYNIKI